MGTLRTRALARRRCTGLTLLELMIALVIVSILVAAALPSYREHARRSLRAEAQAYLLAVQARQQQFLVDTRSYADSLETIGVTAPARVQAAYRFELQLTAGPPQTWLVSAIPTGDQAVEACGTLTVDHTGARGAARTSCW